MDSGGSIENKTHQIAEDLVKRDSQSFSNPLSSITSSLRRDAVTQGISDTGLSAIVAVTRWKEFLNASADPQDRGLMEQYLTTMGFMPSRAQVIAQALRSKNRIDDVYPAIVSAFARGAIDPADFVDKTAQEIKKQFPELSKSQAELLRGMLNQQRRLDTLNVAELVRQFPFPVSAHNFFGRFICGGCDSPQKAVRHLQICNPFLVIGIFSKPQSFFCIFQALVK